MRVADHIVDMGPGAGVYGGSIVAQGTPADIMRHPDSLTGQYLRGEKRVLLPTRTRRPKGFLTVVGAGKHNLKAVNAKFPLGLLTCVTGVSGSGKSTLVLEVLFPSLSSLLYHRQPRMEGCRTLKGADALDKVIDIDQSPIGRTPRSNPATYTGVFTFIRDLFAGLPESRVRGYRPGRYSFNVKGGRCETCQGGGLIKIEMHFLPDVYVTCEACKGQRYNRETLDVRHKGKTIADVLDMTVAEALDFFEPIPAIARKLKTLADVGLALHQVGAIRDHVVRGRGAAREVESRAVQAGHGPHALPVGRADHRAAFCGRATVTRRAEPAGGTRQYRARNRTQPGRDPQRGLDSGPGPGRRQRRRTHRGRRPPPRNCSNPAPPGPHRCSATTRRRSRQTVMPGILNRASSVFGF